MALFCVILANSGSCRAYCVKVHVRYLISCWVVVATCHLWWYSQGNRSIGGVERKRGSQILPPTRVTENSGYSCRVIWYIHVWNSKISDTLAPAVFMINCYKTVINCYKSELRLLLADGLFWPQIASKSIFLAGLWPDLLESSQCCPNWIYYDRWERSGKEREGWEERKGEGGD